MSLFCLINLSSKNNEAVADCIDFSATESLRDMKGRGAWQRCEMRTASLEAELSRRCAAALPSASPPAARITLACLARGTHILVKLVRLFRKLQECENGFIDVEKCIASIHDLELGVAEEDIRDMFRTLCTGDDDDDDGDNLLSVDALIAEICPPLSKSRSTVLVAAFHKITGDDTDLATFDQLRRQYNVRSHPRYLNGDESADLIRNKFIENFVHGDQYKDKVTMEEFMVYYSGISASIESDSYFDVMIRQTYGL